MKRLDNPPNPYESRYREWLEPPPKVRTEVYLDASRSILSRNDSPDIPFRWSVNPYRGCQHACAYCYARPTHEYLGWGAGTDFDSRILVKPNAPELLAREFSRRSWKREQVAFSGVTDCYQPLEAVWELTRRCLDVCRQFRTPVGIVTKSYLIVRDIKLLVKLHHAARVRVYCSITFADDATARALEPGVPPPSRRFEALRRLSEAGVPTSLMLAPIIPGLNDHDIPTILERAAECGARTACYIPLRLPGSVAEVFLTRVREELPDAAGRIEARIREMHGGELNDARFGFRMEGRGAYWDGVRQLFEHSARRFGLNLETDPDGHAAPPKSAPPASVQLPLFGR